LNAKGHNNIDESSSKERNKGRNKAISSIQMHQWSFKLENLENLIGSTKKFLHS
jgi:hypothetical protein